MSQSSTGGLVIGLIAALLFVLLLPLIVVLAASDEQQPEALPCRPAEASEDDTGNEAEQISSGGINTRENVPGEYWEAVEAAAAAYGISTDVLAAQIEKESGWNPDATSPVGAQGIAQFMPDTAADYNLDPADPIASIETQGQYMAECV